MSGSGEDIVIKRFLIYSFGGQHYRGHICEIILNLDQWFRRCRLKIFIIYNFDGHYFQQSDTICANLVEGIIRNIFYNIILNLDLWLKRRCPLILTNIFQQILWPIYSGEELFVQIW